MLKNGQNLRNTANRVLHFFLWKPLQLNLVSAREKFCRSRNYIRPSIDMYLRKHTTCIYTDIWRFWSNLNMCVLYCKSGLDLLTTPDNKENPKTNRSKLEPTWYGWTFLCQMRLLNCRHWFGLRYGCEVWRLLKRGVKFWGESFFYNSTSIFYLSKTK